MLLERRFFLGKIRRVSLSLFLSRERCVRSQRFDVPLTKSNHVVQPLSLSLFLYRRIERDYSLFWKKNTLLLLSSFSSSRSSEKVKRPIEQQITRSKTIYIYTHTYIYTRTMDVVRSEKASLTLDTGGEGGEGR